MTTKSDTKLPFLFGSLNWAIVRALTGLLVILQLLMLSLYFGYVTGFAISSIALGGSVFYLMSVPKSPT